MASRPKVFLASAAASKRLFPIIGMVVLWNRASIYIGFWRYWAPGIGILQYPSRKRLLYFQRGPRRKKVTELGPRMVALLHCHLTSHSRKV